MKKPAKQFDVREFPREDPIKCSRCGSFADARAIECPYCSLMFYQTEAA